MKSFIKVILMFSIGFNNYVFAYDDNGNVNSHTEYDRSNSGNMGSSSEHAPPPTKLSSNKNEVKYLNADGTWTVIPISGIRQHCESTYGGKNVQPASNLTDFIAQAKAVSSQIKDCITDFNDMANLQKNIPDIPDMPQYTCNSTLQKDCEEEYGKKIRDYNQKNNARDAYLNANANMYSPKTMSATQILEDAAAKQQSAVDTLTDIAKAVKIGAAIAAAAAIAFWIASALPTNILLAPALIIKAKISTGISAGLYLANTIISDEANSVAAQKKVTCQQLNKLVTKKFDCDTAKTQTASAGGANFVKTSASGPGASSIASVTNNIPSFIDPTNGTCKKDAPKECTEIVKTAPAGCFKTGGSCITALQKQAPLKDLGNGKYQMKINGKDQTVDASTFGNEAGLMKAGFSAEEAKAVNTGLNGPDGALAKSGFNTRNEMNALITPDYKPAASSYSSGASGSAPKEAVPFKKDVFVPSAEVQALARGPAASATETPTVDYHGEKIGVNKDNLFKMVNRRYNLKSQQNNFIGE